MKVLESRSALPNTHEFVFEFVQFGTITRPACRRTVLVRAASQSEAKKVLLKNYPRSGSHLLKERRELLPEAA